MWEALSKLLHRASIQFLSLSQKTSYNVFYWSKSPVHFVLELPSSIFTLKFQPRYTDIIVEYSRNTFHICFLSFCMNNNCISMWLMSGCCVDGKKKLFFNRFCFPEFIKDLFCHLLICCSIAKQKMKSFQQSNKVQSFWVNLEFI